MRKRLDLTRPVEPELLDECLHLAAQAPTGSNAQGWHFMVVTDPDKRAALADLYRQGFEVFSTATVRLPRATSPPTTPTYHASTKRVIDSAVYLAEHFQ